MIVRSNPTRGILNTSFPLDVRRQLPMAADSLTPPRYSWAALTLPSRAARSSLLLVAAGGPKISLESSHFSHHAVFPTCPRRRPPCTAHLVRAIHTAETLFSP